MRHGSIRNANSANMRKMHDCANRTRSAIAALTLSLSFPCAVGFAQTDREPEIVPLFESLPIQPSPSDLSGVDRLSRRVEGSDAFKINAIQLDPLKGQNEAPVVTAVSIATDQSILAAAGDDHAIRIVSIPTGKTLHTLFGHRDWVQSLAFSPDGTWLASCGNDGMICLWKIWTEPRIGAVYQADHALSTLVFCGSHRLFIAGFSGRIYAADLTELRNSEKVVHPKLSVHRICDCRDIRSLDCSSDLQWLACGGRDGILRVCATATNNAEPGASAEDALSAWRMVVPLHFDRIRSVQFSMDGQSITTVGEDRRLIEFDLPSRQTIASTELSGGKLLSLCRLNENLTAVAGSDNTIRLVPRNSSAPPVKLIGHDGSVSVLQRLGGYLVSAGYDTTIRFWNIEQVVANQDTAGRYTHPVAAQFENSGAGEMVR